MRNYNDEDYNDFQHINNDYNNDLEDINDYNSDSHLNDYTEQFVCINFVNNFKSVTSSVDDFSRSILSWLQNWTIKNDITYIALNELISRIKSKYSELFRDARSLLRTPKKVNVDIVAPRHYYHFGLSNCIETLLSRCSFQNLRSIEVNINIDGLPLFKSSSSQVYPILCNLNENYNEIDVIGIYHGYGKSTDANVFLKLFTKETRNLTINGIKIKDHTYPFKIRSFICDVPAKSFITYTKSHSGYYACSKCTAKGEYYFDKVIYPYLSSCHLRTDNDFRFKLQENHHTGTSVLESISNINMVNDFPSDPMHLIFLGIVKKLVSLWCYRKLKTKLSFYQISETSKLLENQKENIPSEFNRKSRSLFEKVKDRKQPNLELFYYTRDLLF